MKKTFLRKVLLAVTLVLSSTAAVGQIPVTITKDGRVEFAGTGNPKTDDLMSRIQLHGYAQGGAFYNSRGGEDQNTFEIKRVLFWANAQITDRWSFLFMHDFSIITEPARI